MAFAERREREVVSVLRARTRIGSESRLVDERPVGAKVTEIWTAAAGRRLHGAPTLVPVPAPQRASHPSVVLPALRGAFGRAYYYAARDAVDAAHAPAGTPPHGAVAVAEHQTEGRGRLGRTWSTSRAPGLRFRSCCGPSHAVARWPELTLVAAEAVAGAIGPQAAIKDPNDVLVDG